MHKGSSIIGLKVISQAVRENEMASLGTVKDLVFDHETDEVLALVISEKDLFGLIDAQVVPWAQVASIGADAIIVTSPDSKIAAHADPRVKAVMDRQTVLSGTKIYTSDGRSLGTFADLFIDETTGHIVGYEISGGFVSDTMSGKRFIPAPQEINIARDVAIVPPSVADDLEAQRQREPGGLQGAAATVGDKVGGAYDAARTSATGAYANLAGVNVARQKEFVVGKGASRDVFLPTDRGTVPDDETNIPAENIAPEPVTASTASANPAIPTASEAYEGETTGTVHAVTSGSVAAANGPVLVRQGEIITAEHADIAEEAGVLGQLVLAAGGGAAGEVLSSGRDNISSAVASGASTASGVGATVQQKAEAAALGKPAGREVLAPDGAVLVASGTTITPEILERARHYGKEREVVAAAGLGAAGQGVEAVKESAGHLWDTLKHKAAELSEATQVRRAEMETQQEEAKIKAALGRPTNRVILDKSDNVILNAGELITHAAVEQARAAGVLDILLDSVHVGDPTITPEMLRARDHGQAAIESEADAGASAAPPAAAPEDGHPPIALPAGSTGAAHQ